MEWVILGLALLAIGGLVVLLVTLAGRDRNQNGR